MGYELKDFNPAVQRQIELVLSSQDSARKQRSAERPKPEESTSKPAESTSAAPRRRSPARPKSTPQGLAPAMLEGTNQPSIDSDGTMLFPSAGQPLTGKAKAPHITGRMNNTEKAYSAILNERIVEGSVVWWVFESVNLRIGHNCYYRPDFMVQLADGSVELHETKGFMRDDSRVKMSVMKEMYPFRLWLIRKIAANKKKGIQASWQIELA